MSGNIFFPPAFDTLALDASHQGASGGLPRFLDDPMVASATFTAPPASAPSAYAPVAGRL